MAIDSSHELQSQVIMKDLQAGTIGGFTQVLVGQPFDIVKVLLQCSDAYKGMTDTAICIIKQEGPLGFYKGTALPLFGIGACVSLQFGFLEAFKRSFRQRNLTKTGSEQLTLAQLYLSGGGAGVANSVISGPVEHIRIRLQTSSSPAAGTTLNQFTDGPIDALKRIYRSDGLRGWYQGQNATILREFHGYGMYFLGYEWLVQQHMNRNNCTRKDLSTGWAMLYGAGAGYSMWLSSYPLDQIKTRIQTDGLPSQPPQHRKYSGVLDCVRKVWKAEGFNGFTKGLAPTLIRSPLVNGATFAAFETTMKFLS